MIYEKHQYLPFSADAQRLAANLEQAYSFWLSARQSLQKLPASMYWAERSGRQYLYVKQSGLTAAPATACEAQKPSRSLKRLL